LSRNVLGDRSTKGAASNLSISAGRIERGKLFFTLGESKRLDGSLVICPMSDK
jgi:hypothetical protein